MRNLQIQEKNIIGVSQEELILSREESKKMVGYASIDKPWMKYYTKEQQETEMPQMTVYKYLYESNKKYLGRVALSYFGRKITFDELFRNIDSVAKALKTYGIKEGDIVTISLPNIPEAVYLFYALSKIGAISNMIDPRTSTEGIKGYTSEVKSKLLIMITDYYDKVSTFKEEGIVDDIVTVSPAYSLPLGLNLGFKAVNFLKSFKNKSNSKKDSSTKWGDFLKSGKNYNKELESDYVPNRAVVIEHTGGTTGVPKGVVLSNENINAVALQSVLTGIDMKREHNWLDIMPPFIAYGVGMGLHLPLTIGMETILIPKFDASKFDELILKHKPIHIVGVPSYWDTVINSKKMQTEDLSYLIAPTVGGDSMNISLEERTNEFLKQHNCTSKITKGYGMTEVCGGVAGTVPENNLVGSVGIPFVKTTISIFDPETYEELTYGQLGEICIQSPNIMLGYYDNEEETRKILRQHKDGSVWVHSGDLGYMNEDGAIFVYNRIKRLIVRYDGFKIFPSKVEEIIATHPAVESCGIIGIPDVEHIQGKLPKAYIVIKEEYQEETEKIINEICSLCLKKLPEYSQPVDYEIIDKLPLTSVGKFDYLKLEKENLEKLSSKETPKVYIKKK